MYENISSYSHDRLRSGFGEVASNHSEMRQNLVSREQNDSVPDLEYYRQRAEHYGKIFSKTSQPCPN